MKRCRICNETKPFTDFYRMKGMRDGYRNECKVCNLPRRKAAYAANPRPAIERVERWRRENPERYAEKARKYRESGRYAEVARRSHLKRTCGLLCFSCNAALGHLQDDLDRIEAALTYVAAKRRVALLRPAK